MFNLNKDEELTKELLSQAISLFKQEISTRYDELNKMYLSDHDILHETAKESYKPDNRIVANFAKLLVDTMNGYFLGNPIRISSGEESIDNAVAEFNSYNDIDNNNSELGKLCDIFGKGYEIYFVDEYKALSTAYLSPLEGFMIFDTSIIERPLYFIRLWHDRNNVEYGSVSSNEAVRYFKTTGGIEWTSEWEPHYFDGVPATEFVENDEKQGLFESTITMINEYNKALSEKANDVDYFADAYLKIIGSDVDEESLNNIRDNRTIVISGDDASGTQIDFLVKPSADSTQENLINRLERLIFQISMVADINDEQFGTASGIAMRYKLQGMSNLAKFKERKFVSGLNRRYKLIFSHPTANIPADSWQKLDYVFTPNLPANIAEEAETAAKLEGIVSKETQLGVLSIVKNISEEIETMKEEQQEAMEQQMEAMQQMQATQSVAEPGEEVEEPENEGDLIE